MKSRREPFVVALRRVSAQLDRIPKNGAWQDHHIKGVGALWHHYPEQVEATTKMAIKHTKDLPMYQRAVL